MAGTLIEAMPLAAGGLLGWLTYRGGRAWPLPWLAIGSVAIGIMQSELAGEVKGGQLEGVADVLFDAGAVGVAWVRIWILRGKLGAGRQVQTQG